MLNRIIIAISIFLGGAFSTFGLEVNMKHVWSIERNQLLIINKGNLEVDKVQVRDPQGRQIPVTFQSKDGDARWYLRTKSDLTHYPYVSVEYFGKKLYSIPHYTYLNKYFYYQGDLGVSRQGDKLKVAMWSPTAKAVSLLIYQREDTNIVKKISMTKGEKGSWSVLIDENEHGLSYMFEVDALGKKTVGLDPYAKSMESFDPARANDTGRGVLLAFDKPEPRKSFSNMANPVDFVGYEAHIRDFSINQKDGGTYGAFKKNLDHIKNLGVTHIQMMPLQNFYTVKEENRRFQGPKAPRGNINYNWGYDPMNYFTPEGHYSQDSKDPNARVEEVRDLMEAVHGKGMGVILDVVYNHLYDQNTLEASAPGSYMRRGDFGDVSFHSGAGASLESRNLMTRRLIIDSLLWWKNFYGVDGFRFDLMGFTDIETMKEIRKRLGDDTILYGEAWEFTDLPHHEAMTKSQLPKGLGVSAFNDTSRDSYAGHMQGRGFIQGMTHELPKVRAGIVGGFSGYPAHGGLISPDAYHRFAKNPVQALNYLTIHDGFTLWDKINLSYKADKTFRRRLLRQAYTMLMTSQGRVVLHGGAEIARTKPLAGNDPNPDRAHTSTEVNPENGVSYFHENTYRSPDTTNAIDWNRKKEFKQEYDYLSKLIELRRRVPAFRFEKGENITKGLSFLSSSMAWPPAYSAGYTTFKNPKLNELKIRFINAPAKARNQTWYLAGEVHPEGVGGESKNPRKNPFAVKINGKGTGEVILNKEQLANLDLRSWSDPEGLQFKLVNLPGEWGTIPSSYSNLGNNTVKPLAINRQNSVVIDLGIVNHQAGQNSVAGKARIAFTLDNTLEEGSELSALPYQKLLVAHNADNTSWTLDYAGLNTKDWKIILDGEAIDFDGLKESEHQLKNGQLLIAPHSSAVIVKSGN